MNSVYLNDLPSATKDNINTISNILFNDGYQPMLNEFVTTLINRIALTIVRNKSYNNPLALFKKGSIPLGTDIQDIFTNPAQAEQYEYSNTAMAKLLTITDPDTHVAYYRRNRQDLYTKTISREGLQGAFVSWEKFEDYISSITTSLYSGNYIDEFKYTKELIDGAYDNDKVILKTVYGEAKAEKSEMLLEKCLTCKSKKHAVSDETIIINEQCESINDRFSKVRELEQMTADERYAFWKSELSKCIRCHACRNACPACSCVKCVFDNPQSGVAAKANDVSFEEQLCHIIRAFHVSGRCTDCGECSRVCPQGIPLHLLNRKFIKDINGLYGEFQAGEEAEGKTPLTSFTENDCEPGNVFTITEGK